MQIVGYRQGQRVAPLDRLVVADATAITVCDGAGREYHRGPSEFVVGGALGVHTVHDPYSGESIRFLVEAKTDVRDSKGRFHELLTMLQYTMVSEFGEQDSCLWNGKIYRYFISWLRDHVHVMKGMKYFNPELKTAIELYRDSQREDGMIWDNCHRRGPDENYWVVRFTEGGFYRAFEDKTFEFKRIPVENDVEYLYVEGIYFTWKATGDDAWMGTFLESAKRALDYTINDRDYRFSEALGLLKRGYTIDTWDFQADIDCNVEGDIMRIRPGTTRFGAMFGDTTGYIAACRQLAEMLERSDRAEEGRPYLERASRLERRLEEVCWRGTHFQMHVPEDPAVVRDLGVDETKQVSLSNAYSLNRGIGPDKCRAIIESYLGIRAELPQGSPGEWYTIYPPFERGFGGHSDKWQYMNASVTPIVAGELAHGAFENGYERYGADILGRLVDLGRRFDNQFHCSYTGCLPAPPPRSFDPVDLSPWANSDVHGRATEGVPTFPNSPNDLRGLPVGKQTFASVPFLVADPSANGGKGAVGVSELPGYTREVAVPIGRRFRGIYLFHTITGGGPIAGVFRIEYADGSFVRHGVVRGRDIVHWWMPDELRSHGRKTLEMGWKGRNDVLPYLGVPVWAFDNPSPEKEVARIVFEAAPENALWHVLGMTLSEQEAYFPTSPISFGIPNGWGAAAVVYALIEGLAGVVDGSTAFQHVRLSPRWAAADEDSAEVVVTYPASNGYLAYRYQNEPAERRVTLDLTGSGSSAELRVLLPNGEYAEAYLDSLAPQRLEFTYA